MTDKSNGQIRDRIRAWHALATSAQRAQGKAWYPAAQAFCRDLAERAGITRAQAAGVVAALSPSCYWDLNKRQAEALCLARTNDIALEDVVVSTYGVQARKAYTILGLSSGPMVSNISGLLGKTAHKTRAFFYNMLDVVSITVTIDRHILAALGFDRRIHTERLHVYERLAQAFRDVAEELGLRAYELQAIVWLTYKETVNANAPAAGKGYARVGDRDLPV